MAKTSPTQRILALDPASCTGWAHSDGSSGTWVLGKSRPIGEQHAALEDFVHDAIKTRGCDLIATENAGFGSHNPNVQAMHNERLGCIRLIAARHGIEVVAFNPMTIKVFATGHGKAKKEQMVLACQRLLGKRVVSDDEADAIWILELAKRPDCWPQAKAPKIKAPRKTKGAKANRLF